MFFFKKKKIVIDCFTNSRVLHELFPPKHAAAYFPEWWKKLPKSYNSIEEGGIQIERGTMKSCEGFIDLYKKGFVVPMWCDLHIDHNENGYNFKFSNDRELSGNLQLQAVEEHNRRQSGGAFDNFSHAKILMPWAFKEDSGINFLLLEPTWSMMDKWEHLTIPQGVLNFKYVRRPHVNSFLSKKKGSIIIKCGDPLVHFVPLDDRNIKIKTHLVDDNEYLKINSFSEYKFSFRNRQKKLVESLKKNKCPFV